MRKNGIAKAPKKTEKTDGGSRMTVHVNRKNKTLLLKAAKLRGISVRDFVQLVAVEQARREVEGAKNNVIVMTPDEQLAFWNALHRSSPLTGAQKRLGATMRGEL